MKITNSKLLCRIIGHSWTYSSDFRRRLNRRCKRCGVTQVLHSLDEEEKRQVFKVPTYE